MTSPSRLVITELTGSQRSLELGGRAGPHAPAAFGVEMETKKTGYAGNRRSTIQVLHPNFPDLPLHGRWIDRYLTNGESVVQAVGFPDLQTAPWKSTDLVAAFYSLATSGNALRVEWYTEVREGILKRFIPTYGGTYGLDVDWEISFEWNTDDAPAVQASPAQPEPRSEMRQEMNQVDIAASRRPTIANSFAVDLVAGASGDSRINAGVCFDSFRSISTILATGAPPIGFVSPASALAVATQNIATAFEEEWEALTDPPRAALTISDQLVDMMALGAWRMTLAYQQTQLRNGSFRRAIAAAALVSPGNPVFVAAPAGASLRRISFQQYGSSDSWERIADANGLASEILPAAMTLVIPPAGS